MFGRHASVTGHRLFQILSFVYVNGAAHQGHCQHIDVFRFAKDALPEVSGKNLQHVTGFGIRGRTIESLWSSNITHVTTLLVMFIEVLLVVQEICNKPRRGLR